MNDRDTRAHQLIDVARSLHSPSAGDAARVRAALSARIAAEPKLIEPLVPAAAPASAGLAQLLVVFGAGSSLGFAAGFYIALNSAPLPATPVAVTAPSAIVAAPAAVGSEVQAERSAASAVPVPASAEEPPRAEPRARVSAKPTTTPGSKPSGIDLKTELEGLRRAQELLHEGDAAWALARLDELDRVSPSSVLLEERAATRAMAECALQPGASTALRTFSETFPRSAHLERVRASCSKAAVPMRENASEATESPPNRHE